MCVVTHRRLQVYRVDFKRIHVILNMKGNASAGVLPPSSGGSGGAALPSSHSSSALSSLALTGERSDRDWYATMHARTGVAAECAAYLVQGRKYGGQHRGAVADALLPPCSCRHCQ